MTTTLNELIEVTNAIKKACDYSREEIDCEDPYPNSDHPADGVIMEFVWEGAMFNMLVMKS
jgi:hypothetical protein